MTKKTILIFSSLTLAVLFAATVFITRTQTPPQTVSQSTPTTENVTTTVSTPSPPVQIKNEPAITYVGPRENIPPNTPTAYGFWSFAVVVPGVISRSGQPLISEFQWLSAQGWKSVVDLRVDGERGEVGDDTKLPGFNQLGFNYLPLPIVDGHPPTEQQANTFLNFMTNKQNQPAHIHCRGGIGRAGAMIALYRYAVQGWPMDKAIEESRAFQGGVSDMQAKWLTAWSQSHPD